MRYLLILYVAHATHSTLVIIALLYGGTFDKRCFQIAAEQGANNPNTTRAIEHLAMASWRTYEATSAWIS